MHAGKGRKSPGRCGAQSKTIGQVENWEVVDIAAAKHAQLDGHLQR